MNKKRRTVLVFGTFDLVHAGHIHFLERAKRLGHRLIVAIARDQVVDALKGSLPVHTEIERKRIVSSLAMVDRVILADTAIGTYRTVKKVHPDIVALGYDQTAFRDGLKAFLREHPELKISIRMISAYKPTTRKSSNMRKTLSV